MSFSAGTRAENKDVKFLVTGLMLSQGFKNKIYSPHESPHFCATLKSPSLGFPRAAG